MAVNEARGEQAGWYSPTQSDQSCLDLLAPRPFHMPVAVLAWREQEAAEAEEIRQYALRMRRPDDGGDEDTLVNE